VLAYSVEQARVRVASAAVPEPFELDPRDVQLEDDAGLLDADPRLVAIASSPAGLFLLGADSLYFMQLDPMTCRPTPRLEIAPLEIEAEALEACGDLGAVWKQGERTFFTYRETNGGLVGFEHRLDQRIVDVRCVEHAALVVTVASEGERTTGYSVLDLDTLQLSNVSGHGRVVASIAPRSNGTAAGVFVAASTGARHELRRVELGLGAPMLASSLELEHEPLAMGALCGRGCACDAAASTHVLFVAERRRAGRVTFVDDALSTAPITDFDLAGIVRREGKVP
jgi:hypothetical protein